MQISANLGFLYRQLSLPEAIRAAAGDGFDAVECHFPYDTPALEVAAALSETGLPMLGLNTLRGDVENGDFGLSALPARVNEARSAIDQALDYAQEIGAKNIHVMAGITDGGTRAEDVFRENLSYACALAAPYGITILTEPINLRNAPGYHISLIEHGAKIIRDLDQPNLRLMFDCYHTQIMQGDLIQRLENHLPIIGHIQIAAVPDRGEPDAGEVSYQHVLKALKTMGYSAPIGAEYIPRDGGNTGDLGWLTRFQNI